MQTLDRRALEVVQPTSIAQVAVVGGGNSARALSAWLSSRGHGVRLVVRDLSSVRGLQRSRHVRAIGKLEGTFPLQAVTDDWRIVTECSTIFVATVTTAYPQVVQRLLPHLNRRHTVVLFSSKLAGSVEVKRQLTAAGKGDVAVLETDALFACRTQPDESVWVRGVKAWTLFSAPQKSETQRIGHELLRFFPGLEPARNVLQRGLTDFGALCHPITMIANLNAIDRQEPFRFYYDGFTERTVRLLERLEQEFHAIGAAYNTTIISMSELLSRYYGCQKGSLLEAMRSVPNYQHSIAPDTLDHRYLTEDVANTLVPLFGLARKAELKTPMLDSVIHMSSIITGVDFLDTGRTLERLGWESMKHRELLAWLES